MCMYIKRKRLENDMVDMVSEQQLLMPWRLQGLGSAPSLLGVETWHRLYCLPHNVIDSAVDYYT